MDLTPIEKVGQEDASEHFRVCLRCYEYLVKKKVAGEQPTYYQINALTGYDTVFQKTRLQGRKLAKLRCDLCDAYLFITGGDPCTDPQDPITDSESDSN